MNRTYICALGNGNYAPSLYFQNEFESKETRYVQIATMQLWGCTEWAEEENDKIILLTTTDAKAKCLDDHRDRNNQMQTGLYNEMLALGIDERIIKVVPIHDGRNEQEIMDIFEKLNKELSDTAERRLYCDVTYGLRYLPMLIIVANNYSRFVNKTVCEHIAYGSFTTPINGKTPIISLDWLDYLQIWTTAAENFINSGYSNKLQEAARLDRKFFNREKISTLPKLLENVTNDMQTCQGRDIIEAHSIRKLVSAIRSVEQEDESYNQPTPLIPLFEVIEKQFADFTTTESWGNGLQASKWCSDHQMYQQALTLLQETGFTYICIMLGLDWGNRSDREIVSKLRYILFPNKNDKSEPLLDAKMQAFKKHIEDTPCLMSWAEILNACTVIRNNYNHASMLSVEGGASKNQANRIIGKIKQLIEKAISIDCTECKAFDSQSLTTEHAVYFIDISNHDATKWEGLQRKEAEKLGNILHLDFPRVGTELTCQNIKSLAHQMAREVLSITCGHTDSTIHVMGEMTLTYHLVKTFKDLGFVCVASVTERISETKENNVKVSTFQFAGFREY